MCHHLYRFREISIRRRQALFVIVAVRRPSDWILNLTTFSNALLGVPRLVGPFHGHFGTRIYLQCLCHTRAVAEENGARGSLRGGGMYRGSQGLGPWDVWWNNANRRHWDVGKCADALYGRSRRQSRTGPVVNDYLGKSRLKGTQ